MRFLKIVFMSDSLLSQQYKRREGVENKRRQWERVNMSGGFIMPGRFSGEHFVGGRVVEERRGEGQVMLWVDS